jgi:hypothetical protein
MRLINSEDVKALINSWDSLPWEEEVDELVDRIPTAFDVDKVLKQLSEKNRAYYERGLMYEKNGKISSALSINDRAEGIEIAYEIVKAGGIDEN